MKGSVFVLVGCVALFFAAPSHSYSVSGDDQLASRRGTRSGSRSTGAATSGDASSGDDSAAGGARAGKSRIRKRNTLGLVTGEMGTGMPPLGKAHVLDLFRELGKYGAKCLEQAFDNIEAHGTPTGHVDVWDEENLFTRFDMVKWLEIMKDSVSECLMASVNQLNPDGPRRYDGTSDPVKADTFADAAELLSAMTDIGRMLKKCFEDVIGRLGATAHVPGDAVPIFSPDRTVAPYPDSVPVITTYNKRNSPDKPGGYRHYSNLPDFDHSRYVYDKDIPKSIARQFSGSGGDAGQLPYTQRLMAENLSTIKPSLLQQVADEIRWKLEEMLISQLNMGAATVPPQGRRGRCPRRKPGSNPECVHERQQ